VAAPGNANGHAGATPPFGQRIIFIRACQWNTGSQSAVQFTTKSQVRVWQRNRTMVSNMDKHIPRLI
jgi:hypothetical protein